MFNTAIQQAKEEVMWGVRQMVEKGYALGTAGNISARVQGHELFVITPSSMNYSILQPEDLCVVDMEGEVLDARHKPSVETTMHRYLFLLRPEVNGIVHSHSKYATLVASIDGLETLPILDVESVSYLGGETPIAAFYPAGSLELAEAIRDTVGTSAAILMANHGAIGLGTSVEKAMIVNDNIERTCEQYLWLRAIGGQIKAMPADYVSRVKELSLKSRGVIQ